MGGDRRKECLRQSRHEHEVTPLEQRHSAARTKLQQLRKRAPAERVKEIRTLVRRGTDVELVPREKVLATRALRLKPRLSYNRVWFMPGS